MIGEWDGYSYLASREGERKMFLLLEKNVRIFSEGYWEKKRRKKVSKKPY